MKYENTTKGILWRQKISTKILCLLKDFALHAASYSEVKKSAMQETYSVDFTQGEMTEEHFVMC